MEETKMPPQLSRLALITIAIVVLYFVARFFLVPASFGKYGHYRADALKDYAALPIAHAGTKACLDCHSDIGEKKAKGGHKSVGCESCHGAQAAHAEDPTIKPPEITDHRFCVRCHEANPSRPEKFPQVNVAEHAGNQNCTECHVPHNPKESP